MDGLPVTVRLLDPPLHEFLPKTEDLMIKKATVGLTAEEEELLEAAEAWHEFNPMLGTRGVRLGVVKPGLYAMQVRALMEAAAERAAAGGKPIVEVMIPLTVSGPELALARSWVEDAIKRVGAKAGKGKKAIDVTIGTMVETPRAAMRGDEIAEHADFFSFGTNDLTQMTFGFSRDDVEGRMMTAYLEQGLLPRNPFDTLDQDGVGALVVQGAKLGRKAKPNLKLGVCGEHGGDPESIEFFVNQAGLDYVSCSPLPRADRPPRRRAGRDRPRRLDDGVRLRRMAATKKTGMQPGDVGLLVNVDDPRVSPDGSSVAYVVTTMNVEANEYRTRIWIVATDGQSAPRPFTAGASRDKTPRWSPDGTRLAFVTHREEKGSQLYVLPVDGGG